MIGQLDLGLGGRRRLKEHRDLDEHDRLGGLLGAGEARHRGVELPLRDALAGGDLAPSAERGRGGRGQVAGHARQLVVAGPPAAHRPGERGRRRFGQVAEEAEPGLFGLVGVVELLDRVAAALDFRPQLGERAPAAARLPTRRCTSTLSSARSCPLAATRTDDGSALSGRLATTTGRTPACTPVTPVRVTRAPSVKTVTPVIGVSAFSCPVLVIVPVSVMVTASHGDLAPTGIWSTGSGLGICA